MIDPTKKKLAAMAYRCNAYGTWPSAELSEIIEIVSTLNQRVGELERRLAPREPHPNEAIGYPSGYTKEAKPDVATAIRRAAELSVDHITAWFGQGTSSSMAKSMTEEIERNMIAALREATAALREAK